MKPIFLTRRWRLALAGVIAVLLGLLILPVSNAADAGEYASLVAGLLLGMGGVTTLVAAYLPRILAESLKEGTAK